MSIGGDDGMDATSTNATTPMPENPATRKLAKQRVIVTGAAGQLGTYLRHELDRAGATVIGFGSRPGDGVARVVDISDATAVREAFRAVPADVVIHAAAYTDVDGCERDPNRAHAVNGDGARHVAEAANEHGAYLIAVGTDFVFPGDGGAPYAEHAPTR